MVSKIYFRKFNELGSITFTKMDSDVEQFLQLCEEKEIGTTIEKYSSFFVVLKTHSTNKRKIKKKEKRTMAKNWTLKEAVAVITEGKSKEEIQELGKRYPITAVAIAKLVMNDGLQTIMSAMPDHVTMLKLERALKDGVEETEDDEDEVDDTAGTEDAGDEDLESMTTKQLYALCVKRGIKANKYGKPKSYYIELLTGNDAAEANTEEAEAEEEEAGESYEDMNAMDLYKLCKKRGIKAEPKKTAKEYIKLLKAADAEAESEEADDDWDDEEEEEKKPVAKKAPKKEEKKPAKKESSKKAKAKEEEEDEEDDWDI